MARRFDIDDDRVASVDQVIVGISEEGWSAQRAGPLAVGSDGDELRRHLAGSARPLPSRPKRQDQRVGVV
jgi:hypothetical protein